MRVVHSNFSKTRTSPLHFLMFLIYIVNAACTLSHFVMFCRKITILSECSMLSLALFRGILGMDVFVRPLLDAKADPNTVFTTEDPNESMTLSVLHWAAKREDEAVIQLLLGTKADPNAVMRIDRKESALSLTCSLFAASVIPFCLLSDSWTLVFFIHPQPPLLSHCCLIFPRQTTETSAIETCVLGFLFMNSAISKKLPKISCVQLLIDAKADPNAHFKTDK
jgi:hypothetical protein